MAFCLVLILAIGMLAGGVADRDKYETVECTLPQIWGCLPICHDYDYEGGGGGTGGGGEKRNVEEERCQGAAFTCNLEWTYNGTRFTANGVDASWDTSDYSCEKLRAGMTATVVIAKSEPATANDVEPPDYTRTPLLLINAIVVLAVAICVGMCGLCYCKFCKKENDSSFSTV